MLVLVIRTLILYLIVVISMRIMGKRQIGEMQPSELVVAIMISDLASVPMQAIDLPLLSGIVPVFTLIVAEIIMSVLGLKSRLLRKLISGEPSVIISNGHVNEKELARLRFNLNDLLEQLRISGNFDICEIETAILETNGQLSVLLKPPYQTASVNDLKGNPQPDGMPCLIVSDGKILTNAMKSVYLDKKDVQKIVKQNNLQLKDVFIMTASKNGDYSIVKKEK